MPLYHYQDQSGRIVERLVPLALRDSQAGLTRLEVPLPIAFPLGRTPERGVDVAVPRALRQIEGGRLGAREISRHFGFSVDEIKRTWKI